MNKKSFLNFWVYVLPLPLYVFFYYYWQTQFSFYYTVFLLITPTLYGYIIPGIGTNVMKKWKFHGPFKIGNYYAHHGFKYAANMNLWFFIATFNLDLSQLSLMQKFIVSIANGAIHGFFIWIHDTLSIRYGKIELTNILKKEGMSPEAQAFSFAPATFFGLGFSYCLMNLSLFSYLETNQTLQSLIIAIISSFVVMMTVSSSIFAYLEFHAKKN